MKFTYISPSVEVLNIFSGSPICGSTGETFVKDKDFDGINDWSNAN